MISHIEDPEVRGALTKSAHRDLIASGNWSYRGFVRGVDDVLGAAGVAGLMDARTVTEVTRRWGAGRACGARGGSPEWTARRVLGTPTARRIVLFVYPVTSRIQRLPRIPTPGEHR